MNEPTPRPSTAELELQAYHDGELSLLARWRLERRLRRSPELRRELAALARAGDWVRAGHAEAVGPDVWDAVALRLPAADARRRETAQRSRGVGWLAWPGAAAATAGLVVAFALGWFETEAPATGGVVRWLDSGGRDVMVLEGAPDTTIVWVIDGPGGGAL